jgi:SagB-type dehydrogenase family enzyme
MPAKLINLITILSVAMLLLACTTSQNTQQSERTIMPGTIPLPIPIYESSTSVEEALYQRRSIREYKDEPLTLKEVSQLLWAAQGITHPSGKRTAPSAGALYPLEVYLLAGEVDELPAGIYKYLPHDHALTLIASGDHRQDVFAASLGQEMILEAPASIIISAIYERTSIKYGQRAERYVHMEVGSVAENIYLQAESLGIGTVFIGAFSDDQVKGVLNLPSQEQPLAIFPVGRK